MLSSKFKDAQIYIIKQVVSEPTVLLFNQLYPKFQCEKSVESKEVIWRFAKIVLNL